MRKKSNEIFMADPQSYGAWIPYLDQAEAQFRDKIYLFGSKRVLLLLF